MKRDKAFKVPQRPAEDSRRALQILLLTLICFAAMVAPGGAQSDVPPLQWGVCPEIPGQECATLRVPLDYRAPAGRTIEVAISRVKSTAPGARRGVLLLNPGGPGGEGLDLPRMFSDLLPQSVLDAYDLIGFDPRFVGTSTPVSCGLTEREADQALFPLEQPGGFPATAAFMREVADRCHGEAGDVLRFATTANTARDMEQIRQALGEEKISYLGYSYSG